MTKVKIDFTSTIVQEQASETFTKTSTGEMVKTGAITRISYLEDDQIPVKILIKPDDVIIRRGQDQNNYSQLHFVCGEQKDCRYVAQGYQMDLKSSTQLLKFFSKNEHSQELQIEYELFSGLYLVGKYTVTLIFT